MPNAYVYDLQPGFRTVFRYPEEFVGRDDYSAHRGQVVTVLRACTPDEADQLFDDPEGTGEEFVVDQMYKVQADDGWIGDAWFTELVEP